MAFTSTSATKSKSSPANNTNVQRQTLRGFGDPAIDEVQETDVQTQLDHARQFGHGVSQSIQRQAEPGLEEDEETLQRQAESGLEDEEEELPVQAKLTIGQPGDKYEQEADRMAAKVMRMAEQSGGALRQAQGPGSRGVGAGLVSAQLQEKPLVQRERIPDEKEEEEVQMRPAVQREVMAEEEEETLHARLQAKGGTPEVPGNFEGQLASHRGGGQPLSDQTRAFMEPRFGADFSGVRVHETPDLANAIQAQAFTHGQDIYFNSGKYNPGSSGGKELLAHELTHVVQQTNKINRKPNKTNSHKTKSLKLGDLWLEDLFRIYLRSKTPLSYGPLKGANKKYSEIFSEKSINNSTLLSLILKKVYKTPKESRSKRFPYYIRFIKKVPTKNLQDQAYLVQKIDSRMRQMERVPKPDSQAAAQGLKLILVGLNELEKFAFKKWKNTPNSDWIGFLYDKVGGMAANMEYRGALEVYQDTIKYILQMQYLSQLDYEWKAPANSLRRVPKLEGNPTKVNQVAAKKARKVWNYKLKFKHRESLLHLNSSDILDEIQRARVKHEVKRGIKQ